MNHTTLFLTAAVSLGCVGSAARGQITLDINTNVQERLAGQLLSADGAPAPEPGDQIGAFFGELVIGVYDFTSAQADPRTFSIEVNGADDAFPDQPGPAVGQSITFQFFDSSRNLIDPNVEAVNDAGESVNVTFQGTLVPNIPGLPIDLTPSRDLDLRLLGEAEPGPGGGDGGGGGQTPTGNPDVDGDGRVTRTDAAMVLRVVVGSTRTLDPNTISRADVNGDGVVNTADAIEVLRSR